MSFERGLMKLSAKEVLIHGELHHDNILQNGDDGARRSLSGGGRLVIDPKGVIGDTAFEPAAYLSNPIP